MTDHITVPRIDYSVVQAYCDANNVSYNEACAMVRAALAGAAQAEPVAVGEVRVMGSYGGRPALGCLLTLEAESRMKPGDKLYTAPKPAQPVAVPLTESQQRMLHDFPALQQFHTKHSLGPMRAPSCFCCGQQTNPLTRPVAAKHLELPGIVVCKDCKDATEAANLPAAATVPVLEPLTEAQIDEEWFYSDGAKLTALQRARNFARAVEAAHAAKLAKLNGITPPAEGGA